MELRKWLFLLCLLPALALAAGSKRTAMVVETRGKNLVTIGSESARMRTLQVLPEGATITVPQGAVLRLTYFSSGKKEKVIGPCRLLVTAGARGFRENAHSCLLTFPPAPPGERYAKL